MNAIEKRLNNLVTSICEEYSEKKECEETITVSQLSEKDTIEFARLCWELDNRNLDWVKNIVDGNIQTAITLSMSSMQNSSKIELAKVIENEIILNYTSKMQFLLNTELN